MMKAKEIKEIRGLTVEKLEEKLQELKKDLFMLRMQHATNQLENPLQKLLSGRSGRNLMQKSLSGPYWKQSNGTTLLFTFPCNALSAGSNQTASS